MLSVAAGEWGEETLRLGKARGNHKRRIYILSSNWTDVVAGKITEEAHMRNHLRKSIF
jgi:hypothetical protein